MLRECNHKLALIVKKRMTAKVILLGFAKFADHFDYGRIHLKRSGIDITTVKASRTSVEVYTPNHIRYGYEALDSNMQVIQRARPSTQKKMRNMRHNVQQRPSNASQILN